VREATIFGEAVHALIDGGLSPRDLGLEGAEVHDAHPNLEDVFVALTRAQPGDAASRRPTLLTGGPGP
jgi:ABC-2 type transport system ATP-binding protein